MLNKYGGICGACGGPVPAQGGRLEKVSGRWAVFHLACDDNAPGVNVIRFSSGAVITQNKRGRCEDAPCCGCCT